MLNFSYTSLARLPELHQDPFDRLLIAQSQADKIPHIEKSIPSRDNLAILLLTFVSASL